MIVLYLDEWGRIGWGKGSDTRAMKEERNGGTEKRMNGRMGRDAHILAEYGCGGEGVCISIYPVEEGRDLYLQIPYLKPVLQST